MLTLTLLTIPFLLYAGLKLYEIYSVRRIYRVGGVGEPYLQTLGIFSMLKTYITTGTEETTTKQLENYKKFGRQTGIYHTFFGPFNYINLTDPEAQKKVMTNSKLFPKFQLTYSENSSPSYRFFGKNLAFMEGEEWQRNRHFFYPISYNVEKFYDTFETHIKNCVTKWDEQFDKQRQDKPVTVYAQHDLTKLFLDILGETVLGVKFNAKDDQIAGVIESYRFFAENLFQPVRAFIPILNKLPTKYNKQVEMHVKRFDGFLYSIIEEARHTIQTGVDKNSILDLIILDEKNLAPTNKQIRDAVVTAIINGHDTTSSAVGFGLYSLAKHQHIQQKLYEELCTITIHNDLSEPMSGSESADFYDQLIQLKYLDWFFKENIRMYPPSGSVLPREAAKDTVLCDYFIPKGTMINVSIISPCHSDAYFGDDVDEFKPERWSDSGNIPEYAYKPFGSGSRKCPGYRFSMIEQKLFFYTVLKKYKIELEKGYQFESFSKFLNHMPYDFKIILTKR
ncbi:cytochrome P450 [Acrasis kona]|uniref:Cytochrome P450 n=1 Tax=Acrasis kona TaxID=1008807 RepID=A0AAW2ZPL5_9EUKA